MTMALGIMSALLLAAALPYVTGGHGDDALSVANYAPENLLPVAYGHGLGLDRISSITAGERKIDVLVEMPQDFTGGSTERIVVTAVDDITDQNVQDITYLLGVSHNGSTVFRDYFFAADGILYLDVQTSMESDTPPVIVGMQDGPLNAWRPLEDGTVRIDGSAFGAGGLYTFDLAIYSIGDAHITFEEPETYYADLSVIESASYAETGSDGGSVTFGTKSYFDGIDRLEYDYLSGEVSLVMPFDWSETRMSHIPVVHVETHFPKEFLEFHSLGYVGHVNGVKLFKSSVVTDDYTMDGERIVHFVLLQDHIRFIKNELKKSGEPLPDHMAFKLAKVDDFDFPLIAYTLSEDFFVNLSWDPREIEPGEETMFVFTIRDGKTGEPLRNSDYTFVIEQNGERIYETSGQARIGGQFVKFTFGEDQTGPTTIKFENIRGTGQETEFGIMVIPEFGTLVILLVGAIAAVVVLTRMCVGRTRIMTCNS